MKRDAKAVKAAAEGRWREVLVAVGMKPEWLTGKNQPCPKCGGTDRFAAFADVEQTGGVNCRHCHATNNGDGLATVRWWCGCTFPEAVKLVAERLGMNGAPAAAKAKPDMKADANVKANTKGKPRIVAAYDYRNEVGGLLFQVVRYDPKDFRQRRPKPGGGWDWSVKGLRQVPYRLPELLAEPTRPVCVVEGEKDVHNLAKAGVLATCNAGGAGKWRAEHAQYLRGRAVAILPDNDEPGRKHAEQVARSLRGVAQTVRIVALPDLPGKGDVSDWLAAGGNKDELRRMIDAAAEWQPTAAGGNIAKDDVPRVAPYVPFPTDALPATVARFVREGAAALGCDESFVALPTLAMLAAAVGNSRRIKLKRSWCEPAMVWAVVVGNSGTLKSPAHDLALKPLRRIQTRALARYDEELADYERALVVYEGDLAEWKKSGHKNGEPAPERPEEPIAVRYIASDCTIEALAVLLQKQPRGLLVERDELSGWVNSFDAYKACRGADVAQWLSLHRAGPLLVDRKTGGRKLINVPRASVSLCGGVQPKALAAALVGRYAPSKSGDAMDKPDKEHFDNGLAARLLFAMPPRRPKCWTEDDLPEGTEAALERLVERLLDLDMPCGDDRMPAPRDIPLSAEGQKEWIRFYNDHAREQTALNDDLAAAWSKLEGYAARFALLVHLIRAETGDPTLADPGAVDEQSIATGVALSRWFGDETARVYAEIGGDGESPEAREERALVRIISDRGGSITVRDLMQARRRYRESATEAEAALKKLLERRLVALAIQEPGPEGGRPVLIYTLHKGGNGNTTDGNAEETGVLLPLPPPVDVENAAQAAGGVAELAAANAQLTEAGDWSEGV